MNERLRRHRRLIAGSLMLLLVAGVGYVLRSDGSAHAQSVQAVAHPHPVPPAVATASQRRARGVGPLVTASAGRGQPAAVRTTRPTTPGAGVPSPPPTPSGVALALKQTTGLSPAQVTSRRVCPRAAAGHASCAAETLVVRSTDAAVHPRVVRYPSLGRVRPALARNAQPAANSASATYKALSLYDVRMFFRLGSDLKNFHSFVGFIKLHRKMFDLTCA